MSRAFKNTVDQTLFNRRILCHTEFAVKCWEKYNLVSRAMIPLSVGFRRRFKCNLLQKSSFYEPIVSYHNFPGTSSVSMFVLMMENINVKHRAGAAACLSFAWSIGMMILALLGYLIRDWRILSITAAIPGFVNILFWWLVTFFCFLLLKRPHQQNSLSMNIPFTTWSNFCFWN